MAVVNTLSTVITGADSQPRVLTNAHLSRGQVFEAVGTVEVAAADSDTSTFRFARLRSSDRVSSIHVWSDAITAGTSFDIGLYRIAADGGAVVDADLFASAVDLSSAVAGTDVTFEATATNISQIEKRLWELLGLSSDPGYDYDVVLTANTVGSAAGTISLRVRFCAGN